MILYESPLRLAKTLEDLMTHFGTGRFCSVSRELTKVFEEHNIDVATLSSTHLPFLLPILEKSFPKIIFLNPFFHLKSTRGIFLPITGLNVN